MLLLTLDAVATVTLTTEDAAQLAQACDVAARETGNLALDVYASAFRAIAAACSAIGELPQPNRHAWETHAAHLGITRIADLDYV